MTRNDGKNFEKLVSIIQEGIHEIEFAKVRLNVHLDNNSGRKRQFDIIIDYELPQVEFRIAIECKNHKRPIQVSEIESFAGKCNRHPTIHKRFFVSSGGYQSDAINAAKELNIELFKLNEITSLEVQSWFTIEKLQLIIEIRAKNICLYVDVDESLIDDVFKRFNQVVLFKEEKSAITIQEMITKTINNKSFDDSLWAEAMLYFMTFTDDQRFKSFEIPYQLELKNVFVLTNDQMQYPLLGFKASAVVRFESTITLPQKVRYYENIHGKKVATSIAYELEKGNIEIVIDGQDLANVFIKGDESYKKAKNILSYSPKTKEFRVEKN